MSRIVSIFIPERARFLQYKTKCSLSIIERINARDVVYNIFQEMGLSHARFGCNEMDVGEVNM